MSQDDLLLPVIRSIFPFLCRHLLFSTSVSLWLTILWQTMQVVDKSTQKCRLLNILTWRTLICVLAVVLAWSSSLTVSYYLVSSIIPSTAPSRVVERWKQVGHSMSLHTDSTKDCGGQELTRCMMQLNYGLSAAQEDLQRQNTTNRLVVQSASAVSSNCSLAISSLLNSLYSARTNGTAMRPNPECTSQDLVRLDHLLQLDLYATLDAKERADDDSRTTSAKHASNFESSLDARLDYDRVYLRNKTASIRRHLETLTYGLGNISVALGSLSPHSLLPSVRPHLICLSPQAPCDIGIGLKDVVTNASAVVRQQLQTIDQLLTDAVRAGIRWQSFGNEMASLIASVVQFVKDTAAVIPFPGGVIPVVLPPLPMPDIPPLPDFETPLPAFPDLSIGINITISDWFTNLSVSLGFLHANVSEILNMVELESPTLLEDYNPPPLNFSKEEVVPDRPMNHSTVRLISPPHLLSSVTPQHTGSLNNTALNPGDLNATLFNIAALFRTSWEFPVGSVDTSSVEDALQTIGIVLVVFDILYRVIQTVRILRLYCITNSLLPIIDMRRSQVGDNFSKSENEEDRTSNVCRWMLTCTGPLLSVAGVAVFIIILAVIIGQTYFQIYSSFVEGCVETRSGTTITNNLKAIASRLMTDKTLGVVGEVQIHYDTSRTIACQTLTTDEVNWIASFEAERADARREFETRSNDSRIIDQCLLWTRTVDNLHVEKLLQNAQESCNATFNSRSPFTTPLRGSASGCLSLIGSCQPQCPLSSADVEFETHLASCHSEWLIHSNVIIFLLSVLVCLCLNISRILLVNAVGILLWRQIGASHFTVQSSCTLEGATREQFGAEETKSAIRAAMGNHFRLAILQLIGSVLVHIPYLYVLIIVSTIQEPS